MDTATTRKYASARISLPGTLALALLVFIAGCGGASDESSYSDDMAEQHADDSTQATAMVQPPQMPVNGSTISYHTTEAGETITGYFARPESPDSVLEARGMDPATSALPGILVIHEWWGLNDNIRGMARRLAGQGYQTLAVDLYGTAPAETPDQARGLMQQAMQNPAFLMDNIAAAHLYLRQETGAPRVGVIGWCFGGGMALNAAIAEPQELDAAAIYYGRVSNATERELAPIQMPIIGFFGGQDSSIPVEDVRQFEQTLSALGKDAEIYVYEDAGHAFANPSGNNYAPEAAQDAWEKAMGFFDEALAPSNATASAE